MSPQIVTEFIEGQVSAIIKQIEWPKTNLPEVEIPALHADLMVWWEEDRKRRADWTACK